MGGTATTDTGRVLSTLAGSDQSLPAFFMKPTSIVTLAVATLIAVGSAVWLGAGEKRNKPWPKPTPPPPASQFFEDSPDRAQTVEEIDRDLREHNDRIEREIELAVVSHETARREAAFVFLLPELLQVAPDRVTAMVARQARGKARDTLRTELTRQWIATDASQAIAWIKSLDKEERRASATTAVTWMAPHDPDAAVKLANELGIRGHVRAARD
jgi:hypothetical protein